MTYPSFITMNWKHGYYADAGYTYGWDQVADVTTNAISESRLRAALARTDSGAFNIFGGANFKNNAATLKAAPPERKREAGSALLRALIHLLEAEERRRGLEADERGG